MTKSLDVIFKPRSIAVIGVSRRRGTIGREILRNLLEYGFTGALFPVNPRARVVASMKCYPSVLDIPDPVDLAVVVVPRDQVLDVVDGCGRKGAKGVIVISAGFKEVGGKGREREERIVETVRTYGMRLVGPNCMGALCTDPRVRMNATFSAVQPLRGPVGFMSQSGALGDVILARAREINLGFSTFLSAGNKADISGNDLLVYWRDDPQTQVILLYLESFGNPWKFTRLAREITLEKPILAVKAGRTRAGARAASSHTGALAGLDEATDALFEQCGVLRVGTVEELFDLAQAFAHQPLPAGNRVAIVTNAGGPGILAADACEGAGLVLPRLSPATEERLRAILPEEASTANPVDLLASAGADRYRAALDIILADPVVDAAIVVFVPPIMIRPMEVAQGIAEVSQRHPKTVLGSFMGREEILRRARELKKKNIPMYSFPESAAKALAAMDRYRRWRARARGEERRFTVDLEPVQTLIGRAREAGREHLTLPESLEVLRAYGIPVAAFRVAATVREAEEAAWGIGFPVALKIASSKPVHKTEVGGVLLDCGDAAAVQEGFSRLEERMGGALAGPGGAGILVQEMVKGGREIVMGSTFDPTFGPVLMIGLGGIYVEVLRDLAFRIPPLTDLDVQDMLASLRSAPLLRGVRGERGVDIAGLTEALQRLAQLVGDFPAIAELDVNPFVAAEEPGRSRAVDARILLAPPGSPFGP